MAAWGAPAAVSVHAASWLYEGDLDALGYAGVEALRATGYVTRSLGS